MDITFRSNTPSDLPWLTAVWNDVLEDGVAFPGEEPFTEPDFAAYLAQQDAVGILCADGQPAGYYILHPNNIGRCAHVANASYLMDKRFRGKGLGRPLVAHSIEAAKALGFRGMQFNAVVAGNRPALTIYEGLGFYRVGTIPGGFRLKNGAYSDMYILYLPLI